MHIITAAIAGDHSMSATPETRAKVDVWIDNVRHAGAKEAVVDAIARADARARAVRATFNGEDSVLGQRYTFLGVRFDHRERTVCCADKVPMALQQVDIEAVTIGELESVIGKLFYASAVLGHAPLYYWLLKTVRRRLHRVNAGYCDIKEKAELPQAAMAQLKEWRGVIIANEPRHVSKELSGTPRWVMYSDASLQGWGAVLICKVTGEVFVGGNKWRERPHNINAAETRALALAITAFRAKMAGCEVQVFVDNTTTLSAATKRRTRSFAVEGELRALLETMRGGSFKFDYVASADNLADPITRD